MATSSKKAAVIAPRQKPPVLSTARPTKGPRVPSSGEEERLGATEDQVSRTMPPRPDDDEPKQG